MLQVAIVTEEGVWEVAKARAAAAGQKVGRSK
jgi:hypothetical protein